MVSFRLEAEVRAGCIEDDAELAEQVRQQSEALDATKKVTMNNLIFTTISSSNTVETGYCDYLGPGPK